MLTTPNCSSLFPIILRHPRCNVTSLLGQLHVTSNSTFIRLNSSSSWGKTSLAWTCQSLSRTSQYHWCNPWWWIVLHPQHHCCSPILQICRRIRSFLTKDTMQLVVQALVTSPLDYCNSLLAGLLASASKLLQHIQNTAACLIFNLPKFSHESQPCDHHWLPAVAHIRYKIMALAFKAVNITAPIYHTPQRKHYVFWLAGIAIAESKKGCSVKSRLFSFLVMMVEMVAMMVVRI